jgi:hypothetical protein
MKKKKKKRRRRRRKKIVGNSFARRISTAFYRGHEL